MIEFTDEQIEKYSHNQVIGTGYLAYRDIPWLLDEYALLPGKALDLGCGSGRSIGVLSPLCSSIAATDINPLALGNTQKSYPDIHCFLNQQGSHCYQGEPMILSFLS
ncbi:hypothetical protein [Dongshaea marina]|uniref:hypothetical protein n=1 Tax=Dongshaea marina TaxID=2047966 RepID=UPI000D3E96AB|nr:hypothetical protein [Dongshaea marina]